MALVLAGRSLFGTGSLKDEGGAVRKAVGIVVPKPRPENEYERVSCLLLHFSGQSFCPGLF
jgi:hypothetical protein